ncbi:MAG: hypothetical protein QOE83_914 [Actinomycetota bacterium]|nr:hypothetical protein [Actinomycetota bacterium]
MTVVLWIVVAMLSSAVIFLLLALSGATRTVASLKRSLDGNRADDVVRLRSGLAVGSEAPAIQSVSATTSSRRHLIVFADPGCAACETLVPSLLTTPNHTPVVLIGRSRTGWPQQWRPGPGDVVVFDPDERIANAYSVGFTPHVFVVDEGGFIGAQGPADSVEMVRRLVREAAGVQIIHTEVSRGY